MSDPTVSTSPEDPEALRLFSASLGPSQIIKSLEITFERDVTVIAGPNGIGKSTVLRILQQELQNKSMYVRRILPPLDNNPVHRVDFTGRAQVYHNVGFPAGTAGGLVVFDENRTGGIADFASWWDKRDIAHARAVRDSLDPTYRDPQLELFEDAFAAVDLIKGVFKPSGTGNIRLVRGDVSIEWPELSSGERAIITTIGSIAKRAAELLVNFPKGHALLVFIDEIDLHLHPKWQRAILPSLLQAFPSFQFVVTTHSPQVVGSVEARCVRLLSMLPTGEHRVITPTATKGMDSNFILEALMDADDRDPAVSDAIDIFLQLLSLDKISQAEQQFDFIRSNIEGESDPIVARLSFQLELAKSRIGK